MRKLDLGAVQRCLEDPDYPEEKKRELRRLVADRRAIFEENPLQSFWPHTCRKCDRYASPDCKEHRTPQLDFLKASTKIVAAFAGNRFGKSTVLIVWILIQHAPLHLLPRHLQGFKRTDPKVPVKGRLLCPSDDALEEYIIPILQKWCPRAMLRGGSWEKAWSKQHKILHFADGGGTLSVYTYNQEPTVMVGTPLHYVAYDEPPPEAHRKECWIRLVDYDGCERYALTPVNMQGGGIGWLYRKIYKRREAPHITVVRGSSYENRTLPKHAIDAALAEYDEAERAARERGEFVHLGGMVYDGGFEGCLLQRDPTPAEIRPWDKIVGIDPGMRNAAFVWGGFDQDDTCYLFDEVLLQGKTPADYALAIFLTNAKWGLGDQAERDSGLRLLKEQHKRGVIDRDEFEAKAAVLRSTRPTECPVYVIDPSAVNRSLTGDGKSVQSELTDLGVPTIKGNNAVEAGCQQIRLRMQHKRFWVAPGLRGLRGEAEEYRLEDRPDGEFKVVKENDHRLDGGRYLVMRRPWSPAHEQRADDQLGWQPGTAPDARHVMRRVRDRKSSEASPMGVNA